MTAASLDRVMARASAAWSIPGDVERVWRKVLARHDPMLVLQAVDLLATEWPAQLAGRPPLLIVVERVLELEASQPRRMSPDEEIAAARAQLAEERAAVDARTRGTGWPR